MKKINIAFIKYAGCASGGTEKFLQTIAANLNKKIFKVDYFYCDATPYIGWQFDHPDTEEDRVQYLEENGVNLIKFSVEAKDVTTPTHEWVNTNFWNYFDESKYDLIQIARAGHKEYPFYLIKNIPIIGSIWINAGSDNQENIKAVFIPSKDSINKWVKSGGDSSKVNLIPMPVEDKSNKDFDFKDELNLNNKFIYGFHQRTQDELFSDIPLNAYSKIMSKNTAFIIMGGSDLYTRQANQLGLKNFHQLKYSNNYDVEKFLNSLDVYAHGRNDGETFGLALVEAMRHSLPIISHTSKINNGHKETIGNAGKVFRLERMYSREMIKMINNNEYYLKKAKLSRQLFLKKYSKSYVIKKIENIYREIAIL